MGQMLYSKERNIYTKIDSHKVSRGHYTIMTWDNINIEDKTLTLPSAVAKTRKVRRSEDIPDNLWEWLKIIPPEERKGSSIIFLCFHCYCFTRINGEDKYG